VLLGVIVWNWKSIFNCNTALQKDMAEDEALSHKNKEGSRVETSGVKERAENPINREDVHNSIGKYYI